MEIYSDCLPAYDQKFTPRGLIKLPLCYSHGFVLRHLLLSRESTQVFRGPVVSLFEPV